MEIRRILILSILFCGLFNIALPQAVTGYDDYSHLWDDPKAKAKEDKRKAKEEKKRQKEQQAEETTLESVQESIVAADTLQPEQAEIPVDTMPEQVLPQDTIPQEAIPTDTIPEQTIQSDTIPDLPQDTLQVPEPEPEVPVEEEVPEEEVVEKKKREPIEQGPDFRAGLAPSSGSSFNAGLTYTKIGGEDYVGMVFSPEFKIWKFGVGVDVPILYGLESQKIRTDMFKDGVGVLRTIRHVSFGTQKVDPVYVKLGALGGAMVGYGGLVNNYANSTSFEKRKFGLQYDVNYKGYGGIEGLYSDFDPASLNLFVMRPYARPIGFLGIPIVSTLEVGATFVQDKDQTKRPISDTTFTTYKFTEEGISALGFDAGMTLLSIPFIQIDLFTNFSQLDFESKALSDSLANLPMTTFRKSSGASVGFNFRFNFIANVISTDIRIERLNYDKHYVPMFFDANYEINKDAKIFSLAYAEKMKGIYGSLTAQVLNTLLIGGSLMIPDKISDTSPALIVLRADVDRFMDKFSIHANYNKGGLASLKDAFKLDENSLAKVQFVYHMNRFLVVGVNYFYTFNRVSDGSYKPTQFVSPFFGLSIDLGKK